MYWYYFVKLSKSYCRKAFRFALNPEALAMSSSEPMPSPEHGTTTTTALTLAQSALGDRDDGEEATRICQLVRQVGEKKQAKQALIEEATPGRVPYPDRRRIILLHVLLIVLPFVRLLYYV